MTQKKFTLMVALVALTLSLAAPFVLAVSKNTTHATLSSLVFGVQPEGGQVTAIDATSDKAGSKIVVKGRTSPLADYTINGAGSASQTVIPLAYTTGLASNDVVVVTQSRTSTATGYAAYKGTVVGVTASNITLSGNLTSAVASGDRVFEMSTIYSSAVGSGSVSRAGSPLVTLPSDSPVLVELDSTSAGELSATVK